MVAHFLQRRLAFRKPANVPAWIEKGGNTLLERCDLLDVCGYRSNSRTELGAEGSFQRRQFQPRARDILVSWTRAREYRDGEARYLQLAHSASDPDLRDGFVAIAQHYRSLAKIEQSIADQRPNKKGGN